MAEIVTITHTAEGIRVMWPGGTVNVFANAVYLAESYAIAMRQRQACHKLLVEDAAKELNRAVDLIQSGSSTDEDILHSMDELRIALTMAAQQVT